ncbi:hypothetical protein [Jiella sp. M17.18]|uniref:hypothetical protein n=1 Tax=Jiella sp. M17.18 TaxID=3234247 RepID=UPI0034DF7BEC
MDLDTLEASAGAWWAAAEPVALAWLGDLQAAAQAHPLLAFVGLVVALGAVALTRSVMIFLAACFLAIAAVIGADPVADPLKRQVFSVGCFVAIALACLAVLSVRTRLHRARGSIAELESRNAELRSLYDEEVHWRMVGSVEPETPRAEEAPPVAV